MTDYNAAERFHVRQAKRDVRLVERQEREFIANLMSTPAGRAWMCRILTKCHVFTSSYTNSALNTAFAEGERNIGLQHLNEIMAACPDQYVIMMREENGRNSAADTRRRQATGPDADGRDKGPSDVISQPDADGDADTDGDEAPDFGYATPSA
jgi:hypothetical protein